MNQNKLLNNLYTAIVSYISPLKLVGGLSISDSVIRYIRFNSNKQIISQASLRLPPQAIIGGKIMQKDIVKNVLSVIRSMIDVPIDLPTEVIISLSSEEIYSQLFNLPDVPKNKLEEAADLNLQMISPMDIQTSYHSYQIIGSPQDNISQRYDLLGAFVSKSIIDDWTNICIESGFIPASIEFQSLSIVRAIMNLTNIYNIKNALIVSIASEGMTLMIIKNNHLYFDYFYPWKDIQGDDKYISMSKFKEVLINEVSKIMHFSISKFDSEIKNILVSAEGINKEIISILQTKYSTISIQNILIKDYQLSPLWLAALGAAKRGASLRSEDNLISLNSKQAKDIYAENQILNMIKIWRQAISVALFFIFLIFIISNFFLRYVQVGVMSQPLITLSTYEAKELDHLYNQVNVFNNLVSLIGHVGGEESRVYPFIAHIINLAPNIQITKFSFQSMSQPIILHGSAPSTAAVIQFKQLLDNLPQITNIQFPLHSLVAAPGGRASFVLSFQITTMDF